MYDVCRKRLCDETLALFPLRSKTDYGLLATETSMMPVANSVWHTGYLKSVVAEWYGMPSMPMRILTLDEEIEEFEKEHVEIPVWLWQYVNHTTRQVMRWAKDTSVDILIWSPQSQSAKLVQDVCFKDAYPDETAWRKAVFALLQETERAWIVLHEE